MRSLGISFVLLLAQFVSVHAVIIGSYNIRYANGGDVERGDGWEQRAPVIAALIRFHNFDVLGTQEGLLHQLQTLKKNMPEYEFVGRGRDDGEGKGEFAAIFYKREKFRLLTKGDFWLSETPEKPSKGWDASLPRICSWVKLEPVTGGRAFFVFNTHFDHRGVQARLESAALILKKIKEIAGSEPVVATGDFNVDQKSEAYRKLVDSGELKDAYESAAIRYALNGTANGFNPNGMTESRIDHILFTKAFKPLRYGILTDSYRAPVMEAKETESGNFPKEVKFRAFQARLPSDHFPVLAEFDY